MSYHLRCPECKNDVDMSQHEGQKTGDIIECNHCGVNLQVTEMTDGGEVTVEIVEEGK